MKTIKIPVSWTMCAYIEVEANSVEEAIEIALNHEHEVGYDLPDEGAYVDGSFEIESDESVVEDCQGFL